MTEEINYAEMFPEDGWLCPYCMIEVEEPEKALVERRDIPSHLVFQHQWEPGKHMTWEYIYNRLAMVGGI